MKKTTSFHLEEDIIAEIEAYKDKYNLSSRNAALERMLLERRNILSFQNKDLNENTFIKKEVPGAVDNQLTKSIENSYNEMPD